MRLSKPKLWLARYDNFVYSDILVILHTYIGPFYLVKNVQEFLFGYPFSFKVASVIGYLLIPLAVGLAILLWKIWKDRLGSLFSRLYITIVEVSLLILLHFLIYWNFYEQRGHFLFFCLPAICKSKVIRNFSPPPYILQINKY